MYTAGWGATVSEIKTERAATSANKGKAMTIRIVIVRSRVSNHRSLGKGDFFFSCKLQTKTRLVSLEKYIDSHKRQTNVQHDFVHNFAANYE